MALRTMAAKLKQKIPAAVQRVFASSRALATSSSPPDGLNPEFRQAVKELMDVHRKNRRDETLARCAGVGLAAVTFSLGIRRLNS